jgi:diguanylate cyclase (GGDEF)-like protein
MPKMDGLSMLNEIRKIDSTIPSVVTTAYSDVEFLRKAIDLGVRGYCMKPTDMFKLLESIEISVESRILRKKLELQNKNLEELLYQATHDTLTNIFNRQQLNTELRKETIRHKRYNHNLCIIMFDIDHFKLVNDTHGHDVGDEVLINLSTLAQNHIRDIDTLARWGGEEFLILLPETKLEDAHNIAEKLRVAIENIKLIKNKDDIITVSFGITQFQDDDDTTSFLKRVDDALYKAKDLGRNKVISL